MRGSLSKEIIDEEGESWLEEDRDEEVVRRETVERESGFEREQLDDFILSRKNRSRRTESRSTSSSIPIKKDDLLEIAIAMSRPYSRASALLYTTR